MAVSRTPGSVYERLLWRKLPLSIEISAAKDPIETLVTTVLSGKLVQDVFRGHYTYFILRAEDQ